MSQDSCRIPGFSRLRDLDSARAVKRETCCRLLDRFHIKSSSTRLCRGMRPGLCVERRRNSPRPCEIRKMRHKNNHILAWAAFTLLLMPTVSGMSRGDSEEISSARAGGSSNEGCSLLEEDGGQEQSTGGCSDDGIPRITSMTEWDAHVRSSNFTVVGFFSEAAGAAMGDFANVHSQGKHHMAIVDQSPRSWLGTKALPDWLGIDCSHDVSAYAVAAYHSDAPGGLPSRDVDALFGGLRQVGKASISHFIHTRSYPLLGVAASVEDGLLGAAGRCLVAIVHQVTFFTTITAPWLRGLAFSFVNMPVNSQHTTSPPHVCKSEDNARVVPDVQGERTASSKERAAQRALEKVSRKLRDVAMFVRIDRTLLPPRESGLLNQLQQASAPSPPRSASGRHLFSSPWVVGCTGPLGILLPFLRCAQFCNDGRIAPHWQEDGARYTVALFKHDIEGGEKVPVPHSAHHLEEWIAGKCR